MPESGEPGPPGPRRLRRAPESTIAGVAAGVAHFYQLDVNLVRIAFCVATLFGGFGLFAYLAAWVLIPDTTNTDPRPVVINGGASLVFGALAGGAAVMAVFGSGPFIGGFLGPALLIGLGLYLLNQRQLSLSPPAPSPTQQPGGAEPPPPGAFAATSTSTATAGPTRFNDPPGGQAIAWGSIITESDRRPSDPRPEERRAPVTAVTLAVAAIAVGALLALGQTTGLNLTATAVFATLVAIIGAGLVAGAFISRAPALYFFGLLALAGLAMSPAVDAIHRHGFGHRSHLVTDAADLQPAYHLGVGELIIDLRQGEPSEDTKLDITVGVGTVRLYVPDTITLDLDARTGLGELTGPDGRVENGPRARLRSVYPGREGAPVLTVDASVRLGTVEVHRD